MVPNWFIQVSLLAVTGGRSSHRHLQRQRLVHGTVSFQTSTRWKTQSADVRFHPETPLSWWQEWKERRYSQQSRRRKYNTTGSPTGPELWGHSSDPGAGLGIRLYADGFDAPHLEYLCLRRCWVQEKMLSSWSTRKVAKVSLLSDVHGADSVSHHCQSGPGVVFSSSTCLCSQQDEGQHQSGLGRSVQLLALERVTDGRREALTARLFVQQHQVLHVSPSVSPSADLDSDFPPLKHF